MTRMRVFHSDAVADTLPGPWTGERSSLPATLAGRSYWALLIAPIFIAPLPAMIARYHAGSEMWIAFMVWALLDLPHWFSTWTASVMDTSMRVRHRRYLAISTALILIGSFTLLRRGSFDLLFNVRLWLALLHILQMNHHLSARLRHTNNLPPWVWLIVLIAPSLYFVGLPVAHDVRIFGQPVYGAALFARYLPVGQILTAFAIFAVLYELAAAGRRGDGAFQRAIFVGCSWGIFLCYALSKNLEMVLMGTIAAHSLQYAALMYLRNRERLPRYRLEGSRLLAALSHKRRLYLLAVMIHSAGILLVEHKILSGRELVSWYFIFPLSMGHIFFDVMLYCDRRFNLLEGLVGRRIAANGDRLEFHEKVLSA